MLGRGLGRCGWHREHLRLPHSLTPHILQVERFWDAPPLLRLAWAYNVFLLVGGLAWFTIMMRALDADDVGLNVGGFWRTFVLALVWSFFVEEMIKVVLITIVSPPFWVKLLKPGTLRADGLLIFLRGMFGTLSSVL